ncbi:hypothetical protein C2S52_002476 [Perilla frutescens var. hirtella]|uniref:Uncharacterized protein n=1 Tax=Perilla frutescens var. hirtella TaxID=608512 RepID=A0AAD4JBL8_PERFH|nr:hypothetical protein C2S51_012953 [Perilla frutescens var. frutescens]KAH6791999.1 hypothetical protein C2S52_002476 [Perilla frutescens var. hirtella]KAH6830389.1 hypothetical protein C2S53_007555 [Perilla frutescens var. hirtella]
MSELAAAAPSCRTALIPGGRSRFKRDSVNLSLNWRCNVKQFRVTKIGAQMVNPSTYSSRISTDIPLYEIPGEEWRVQMLPIEFLFLTVSPVIDMRLRCKSSGVAYPPGIPRDISKVLDLEIIRWELQGLDDMLKPSQFSLSVKGALYPDRRGPRSRLRGQLQMSISFVLPPVLALVPDDIRRDVAESVLKRLVENMKDKVNGSLTADYSEFKRERPKALA